MLYGISWSIAISIFHAQHCKPFINCDAIDVLTIVVDPVLIDKSCNVWFSVVGWCDSDNELISLLGGDGLTAVVTVGRSREVAFNDATK